MSDKNRFQVGMVIPNDDPNLEGGWKYTYIINLPNGESHTLTSTNAFTMAVFAKNAMRRMVSTLMDECND